MNNGGQFGSLARTNLEKPRECAKRIAMNLVNRFLRTMKMTMIEGLKVEAENIETENDSSYPANWKIIIEQRTCAYCLIILFL